MYKLVFLLLLVPSLSFADNYLWTKEEIPLPTPEEVVAEMPVFVLA